MNLPARVFKAHINLHAKPLAERRGAAVGPQRLSAARLQPDSGHPWQERGHFATGGTAGIAWNRTSLTDFFRMFPGGRPGSGPAFVTVSLHTLRTPTR